MNIPISRYFQACDATNPPPPPSRKRNLKGPQIAGANLKVDVIGVHPVEEAGDPCWLIEIQVTGTGQFDLRAITQREEGVPPPNWQAPYDVHQLSRDGNSGAAFEDAFVDVRETRRLAFFFHYLEGRKPLETSAGPVALPTACPRPGRLQFMRYEPPG